MNSVPKRHQDHPVLYFQIQTRFHQNARGQTLSPSSYARYQNWATYLQGFEEIVLLARVSSEVREDGYSVEGRGVRVSRMPYFHGLIQLVGSLPRLASFVYRLPVHNKTVYAARVADPVASMLAHKARRNGNHFIAQVVGDPAEAMRAGSFGKHVSKFHSLMRYWVKRQVRSASGVIYVTRSVLQHRYPASPAAVVVARSNVELTADSFVSQSRDYSRRPIHNPIRLVTVGGHAQRFKGHEFLLEAIAQLRRRGLETHTVIVGGGRYHDHYRALARQLGVADAVHFTGDIADQNTIQRHIQDADIFVFPSLTEGLPRAVIEAMAQGVACIASEVGGNSELLGSDGIFAAGSAEAIAQKIETFSSQPQVLSTWAETGLSRARDVATTQAGPEVLGDFFGHLLATPPPAPRNAYKFLRSILIRKSERAS